MQLPNGFYIIPEQGQELRPGESSTLFAELDVNVYVKDDIPSRPGDDDGRLIVDCGMLLVQRSAPDNILSIRAFGREKTDQHTLPDLVVPFFYINQAYDKKICSKGGSVTKGKIVISTHWSLNTQMTMNPMVITLKMSTNGRKTFKTACHNGMCNWPQETGLAFV